ncbi:sirohydrochlorin chelatase [Streptomyces sp. NPDC090303]|uniref:sirohydrochlorin chelatase n=1 Tax=Streptomyces sp. NPDC090303 TaxID=3365960 RepID=UPI0037FE30CF
MQQIVLAVHGSVDPGSAPVLARLAARVRALASVPVTVAHLDHRSPSLADALRERPGALVVPVLLGDGYHRTVDIPAVARRFGSTVTRGLSGEPAVALALRDRLRAAERAAGGPADAVVVAGAGSSRPGGEDGTLRAVEQLARHLTVPVTAAYCSAGSPTPAEAVARLRADGFRRVALAAHLLAPGRFTRALAGVPGAWAVTEPLADHPLLAAAVAARCADASDTGRRRPADPPPGPHDTEARGAHADPPPGPHDTEARGAHADPPPGPPTAPHDTEDTARGRHPGPPPALLCWGA